MRTGPIVAADAFVVFVDLQEGIVNVGATNDQRRLRVCVAALADLAIIFALPVTLSCVPTTGGIVAPMLSELAQRFPDAPQLVRTTADAMQNGQFRAALDASGRKTMILAGVATEVAIRLAARSAFQQGYDVVIAVDACSGFDARAESAAFRYLCAMGVELSAVSTIAAELTADFTSEAGRAAMRVLQSTLAPHDHDGEHGEH